MRTGSGSPSSISSGGVWDGRTGWHTRFSLYRRDKLLKEVAEKRLAAIREFTDLGSGIKIAMRDLEIRGAGSPARGSPERAHGGSGI